MLAHLLRADYLLTPRDLACSSLARMPPTLAVVLTIGNSKGDLQVRKSWRKNHRHYDCVSTIWSKLHKPEDASNGLSLPLIDPTDGLAWELAIRATRTVNESDPTEMPPDLRDMIDYTLNIDHDKIRNAGTEGC